MINNERHFYLLENRPVMAKALASFIGEIFTGQIHIFEEFNDLPSPVQKNSIYLLAVHLLPPGVNIPSASDGAVSLVYGEKFTSNCVHWWHERGALGLWDIQDGFDEIKNHLADGVDGRPFRSKSVDLVYRASEPRFGMHVLSPRELQVATLIAQGNSTEEVAKMLGVTEGTIKNQRKAVYRKLGIVRSTQLPHAMGNGFVRKADSLK